MKKFKKGAASFYIVSFSTLILVIIAASFATVIISAISRASNDDLSQSAYDAALAGVEDAKIAYSNYMRCINEKGDISGMDPRTSGELTCEGIIWLMKNPDVAGCDMVALMTGRIAVDDWVKGTADKEVMISDTTSVNGSDGVESNLNQAYTCVKIETRLNDYSANLTSSNSERMIRVLLDQVAASEIKSVKLSWYTVRPSDPLTYLDFTDNGVKFKPVANKQVSAPPTLRVQMVQTANSFTVSQLNGATTNGQTDRATLFLVPTNNANLAGRKSDYNYIGVYNNGQNSISTDQVSKTNDQSISNVPYVVYCSDTSDYACSVTINLPAPIGGGRNDDTFLFLVSLPYGEPDTDFSMEFLCGTEVCKSTTANIYSNNVARISGTQIKIDSTGRANDLYRRVETRLETVDVSFPYTYYALQLFGNKNDYNNMRLIKNLVSTQEYNKNW